RRGGGRLRRRGARGSPRPRRLHLLGLPAAALPEAGGDADRFRAGLPRRGVRGDRVLHRPRGAQGQGRLGPRPGGRRPVVLRTPVHRVERRRDLSRRRSGRTICNGIRRTRGVAAVALSTPHSRSVAGTSRTWVPMPVFVVVQITL